MDVGKQSDAQAFERRREAGNRNSRTSEFESVPAVEVPVGADASNSPCASGCESFEKCPPCYESHDSTGEEQVTSRTGWYSNTSVQ